MSQFNKALLILSILFSLFSCSAVRVLENTDKLARKKTSDLVETLDSLARYQPMFFYSKIATKFKDTSQNASFKTSLRMVRDSAMTASISFASIPIINTLLTKDSLTIVHKRSKCFQVESLNFLKTSFGLDVDYNNIEELLLGLPLDYDTNLRYFQIHDPFNYIISSHRKRDIKRNERKDLDDIVVKYFLTNDAKGLRRVEIESPSDSTFAKINYIERQFDSGFSAPKLVLIEIFTPRNRIQIEMEYEKMNLIDRPDIFIVIPENYEICE